VESVEKALKPFPRGAAGRPEALQFDGWSRARESTAIRPSDRRLHSWRPFLASVSRSPEPSRRPRHRRSSRGRPGRALVHKSPVQAPFSQIAAPILPDLLSPTSPLVSAIACFSSPSARPPAKTIWRAAGSEACCCAPGRRDNPQARRAFLSSPPLKSLAQSALYASSKSESQGQKYRMNYRAGH